MVDYKNKILLTRILTSDSCITHAGKKSGNSARVYKAQQFRRRTVFQSHLGGFLLSITVAIYMPFWHSTTADQTSPYLKTISPNF